jgi:hypothetical protein
MGGPRGARLLSLHERGGVRYLKSRRVGWWVPVIQAARVREAVTRGAGVRPEGRSTLLVGGPPRSRRSSTVRHRRRAVVADRLVSGVGYGGQPPHSRAVHQSADKSLASKPSGSTYSEVSGIPIRRQVDHAN